MSDSINYDLSDVTVQEDLFLHRKRSRQSLEQAAKTIGVGRRLLQKVEQGVVDVAALPRFFLNGKEEVPSISEQLRLARKRSGINLRDISHEFGVSHVTYLQLERNAYVALIEFWSKKGFVFNE